MKDFKYTIDTVPETLYYNQFYCYNKRTGEIMIGTIVGKSALTNSSMYNINGVTYKVYSGSGFNGNTREIELNNNGKLRCFLDYDEFVKNYKSDIIAKEKRQSAKKKYIVNKELFHCRETKAATIPYNYKEFNTKKEAEKYSLNGLKKLKTETTKLLDELKRLKKIMQETDEAIKGTYSSAEYSYSSRVSDFMVKPSKLKENDLIFKIGAKRFEHTYILEIDENSTTTVKGFIKPTIAQLSNGTLLIENECSSSLPYMCLYDDYDKIKELVKKHNAVKIAKEITGLIERMTKIYKYAETYKPFDKEVCFEYFNKKYYKEYIDDINKALECINNKTV